MGVLTDTYNTFSRPAPPAQPQKPRLTGNYAVDANGNPPPYTDWNIINMEMETVSAGIAPFDKKYIIGGRAINFQYILHTGDIPSNFDANLNKLGFSQWIDFSADDPFNRALNTIQIQSQKRIEANNELSALLNKDQWSREDRLLWEKKTSHIISEEVEKFKGFKKYRKETDGNGVVRAIRLNDLSLDLAHGTENIEFDCESMSAVKGVTLQRIENTLLPQHTTQNNYKHASNYFYISGNVSFNRIDGEKEISGHAYIVSSASGAVIEPTAKPENSLKTPLDPNYTFSNFVEGKLVPFGNDWDYYGGNTHVSNGMSDSKIESSFSSLKQDLFRRAENSAKLFVEQIKSAGNIAGIAELKEFVMSANGEERYNMIDMITDTMIKPENAQVLNELKQSYKTMTEDWENVMKVSNNDPALLQKIKSSFTQYLGQIESNIKGLPFSAGNQALMTYTDIFSFWKTDVLQQLTKQEQKASTTPLAYQQPTTGKNPALATAAP